MLAGSTRIRLLRLLHSEPGQNVARLAQALQLSRPFASQELRRIQSRGLLGSVHQGASLIYRLSADPQVHTAQPLLKALRQALTSLPVDRDQEIALIASGLAHERRMAIAATLLQAPKTSSELRVELPMSGCSQYLHLQQLMSSGFVIQNGTSYEFHTPAHPLGRALTKLLQQGICR